MLSWKVVLGSWAGLWVAKYAFGMAEGDRSLGVSLVDLYAVTVHSTKI